MKTVNVVIDETWYDRKTNLGEGCTWRDIIEAGIETVESREKKAEKRGS